MPITIELFDEFCNRMGCDYIKLHRNTDGPLPREVRNGTTYLFENGAVSDGHHKHQEPPTDRWQCLERRRYYWQTKLDDETKAFNQFKNAALDSVTLARNYVNQEANATAAEQLRAGKARIESIRKSLQPILDELEESPQAVQRRRDEEASQKRRSAIDAIERDIMSVNI